MPIPEEGGLWTHILPGVLTTQVGDLMAAHHLERESKQRTKNNGIGVKIAVDEAHYYDISEKSNTEIIF